MSVAEATPAMIPTDPPVDADDRAFLGHPKGLGYLAFTEAWERFSYYGMQALLVLYMSKSLLLLGQVEQVAGLEQLRSLYGGIDGQRFASAIFGTYAASVYLTPIFGGWLADKVLGKRRTVLLGAITMAIGHFLMAFNVTFLLALLCLILGCGMFKGNISSQVGSLYKPDDLRRGDAFQIFYLAINAGVIAAPLIVGTLGETVGWHWGFGAAGVGMLIGLTNYVAGQKYLPKEHFDVPQASAEPRPPLTRQQWGTTIALLLLIPVLAVALVPNNQIFNAYLVWADRDFNLVWGSSKLPTTWLVTLDAVVSVTFLAGVALFWRWWGRFRKEPDELSKLIIGSCFSMAGMLCLVMAAASASGGAKIGLFWPVMFHVLNSIGFAHIVPIGLALFARLAPKQINSTIIGIYFLAFFTANTLVGWVGGWFEAMPTTQFWLMHFGFAATGLAVFVVYKLALGRVLFASDAKAEAG